MVQDLRFAVRQLFKAPGFTIAAVTVLALGIGVNTAVFSLVNTLFFAPPAYAKPHEMVQLFSQDKKDPKKFRGFSYPTYLDIREQNTVFSDASAQSWIFNPCTALPHTRHRDKRRSAQLDRRNSDSAVSARATSGPDVRA